MMTYLEILNQWERDVKPGIQVGGTLSDEFARRLCSPANSLFTIHWDKKIGKAKVDGNEVPIFDGVMSDARAKQNRMTK